MRRHLSLMLVLLLSLVSGCKQEDEVFPMLKVEPAEVSLYLNETSDVQILSGSGKYQVSSQDEKMATATLSGHLLTIKGISAGVTSIKVLDTNSRQSALIKVMVTDEKTMRLATTEIVELKSISSGNVASDLPKEKLKEYFGERISDNTPMEVRFEGDYLHIVKPHGITERYKYEWHGEELYLNSGGTAEWKYCGVRVADKDQLVLNTGFYKGEVRNGARVLWLAKHGYQLKSHTEISNTAHAEMVWARVSFVLQDK